MRKKSKSFRIDCRAQATSMIKCSARSDSKNFHKSGPLGIPSSLKTKMCDLSSSQSSEEGFIPF